MSRIVDLAHAWLEIDPNPDSRHQVSLLIQRNDHDTLAKLLTPRIAFGTAGLRARLAPGFANMNDVTVLQALQGLVQYIIDQQESTPNKSIVVGYDHRYSSQRFAEITACAALSRGLTVYYLGSVDNLLEELGGKCKDYAGVCHTPLVPFTIDYFKASAGVMVTALHNPAQDNGYKVYYNNGCQIIPPHDEGIAQAIDANLSPWTGAFDIAPTMAEGLSSGKLIAVGDEMSTKYVTSITQHLVRTPVDVSFVYTPMHGVGQHIFEKCLSQAFGSGARMITTKEQKMPDPSFPTVNFPNPEEKGALELAQKTADTNGVNWVLANDPDADRFSVSAKTPQGTWRQLTGNEIGILFAIHVLEKSKDNSNTTILNSTVSLQMLAAVAEKNGAQFEDTLTGFKWLGNRALQLESEGRSVPFAYEEAIGFMFGPVHDKDGIAAALVWLQMQNEWPSEQLVFEILRKAYAKYGWFKECNGYYKLLDANTTTRIFDDIRDSYKGLDFPATIGKCRVLEWRDLTVGYEAHRRNNTPRLPLDPKSQMITAVIEGQDKSRVRFTCRGSGTEPKLKVYIEGQSPEGEDKAVSAAKDCWQLLKKEWFDPAKYNTQEVV